jgi:phosphatidylethanolamine-binding protein (PEBP) family uncharacterized protein
MRRPPIAISSAALLAVLALAGCGGSAGSTRKTTNIPFQSPAIAGTVIPTKYTCDGKNVSPPLEWGEVPSGTKELALFVLELTPASAGGASISIDWAIAGVDPTLHKLATGQVPAGAHLGKDTRGGPGYSVCPPKGRVKTYQFALYAVPSAIKISPGFVGLQLLGEIASSNSPTATTAGGQFTVAYKRK